MTPLQFTIPLQSVEQTASLETDGKRISIAVTLSTGVMTFSGNSEAELKVDILSALRSLASSSFVPDVAVEVAAEILTILPSIIETVLSVQDQVDPATQLNNLWTDLFGAKSVGIEPEIKEAPALNNLGLPPGLEEIIKRVETRFGPVRIIGSIDLDDLELEEGAPFFAPKTNLPN